MYWKKTMIVCLALLFLCSCSQLDSTATMKILLHCGNETKTLTVNDTVLDITKYSVSGTGPGNKTFAIDSTSASITLSSMALGNWDITARGLNSKGKTIAEGQLSFVLDDTSSPHTVNLSTLTGNGSLQLKYEWDSDITEPQIKLTLSGYDQSNILLNKTVTPVEGSSSCTLTINDIKSGFYVLSSVLYSSGEKVTGSTEAIRIANGEKTTGTLSFKRQEAYSSDLQSLYVFRSNDSALTGHLSNTKDKVEAGNGISVNLELDSSYSELENFTILWFFDGETAEEEKPLSSIRNEITFYPSVGCHILNAIVKNKNDKSIGSVTWKFISEATGKEGLALYISTVNQNDNKNLFLDTNTFILPMPDERFLVVSPNSGTMRLCGLYNNSITIIDKTAASDEGWYWLEKVNRGFSNPQMSNFVLIDSEENINVLYCNRLKSKIEKSYRGDQLARFEGEYKNFYLSFTDINTASFIPDSDYAGTIILSVSDNPYLLGIRTNENGVTSLSAILKPDGVNNILQLESMHGCTVCTSFQNSNFYYAEFENGSKKDQWQCCNTGSFQPQIIRIINSNNVIISDGTSLKIFNSGRTGYWSLKNEIELNAKFIEVSDDGKFVWIVDNSNTLITYTTADNLFYKIGYVQLNKNAVSMTVSGHSLLIQNSDCSIAICKISEGD